MSLDIRGFIETSLVDWDGKIVCVIFLPGCNFRCPFCQNMGLITHPEKYAPIPESRVFDYLEVHREFIDGVCITGGEPTLQKNKGLTEFIREVKKRGFLVKLDTNGTDPAYIRELAASKLIDFVAMDVKTDIEDYEKAAGVKVDKEKIKESISLLLSGTVDYEFRTTLVPGMIGTEEMAEIGILISGAKKYVLQQFEPENCSDFELKKLKPLDAEAVARLMEIARKHVKTVLYRGK